MILKLEPEPGEYFYEVCRCAIEIVKLLGITVEFTFNGTHMRVREGDTIRELGRRYHGGRV